MLAVLAPGQGAQTPGMFAPWLELPGVDAVIDDFSGVTGLDIRRLGTLAEADEIKDTAVTQPLIVALGVIVASQLKLESETIVAGHSVGELTAAAVAGVLAPRDAVGLAARRGAEMAAACALEPTAMIAVLGGDPVEVVAAIEAAGLTAANRNGAGQIVAAGALRALEAFTANPPAGARLRPLAVAGAFHTAYMAPAQRALAAQVGDLSLSDPAQILLSNSDGTAPASGREVIDRIVAQITRPVRWDLCQATMADLGVTAAIELAPAGALIGMAKREIPGIELLAIKTPDDLDKARTMIADQAERATTTPGAGNLTGWLRDDGDVVAAGHPVVRQHNGSEH